MINRQTPYPKAQLWQVHDEGAIVSLNLDRLSGRSASIKLSKRFLERPSNPTASPTLGSDAVSRGALSAYVRPVSSFDPDDLSLPREDESGRRVAIRMCF